ncbi:zinc finger protein ZAT9-like [Typha latifolia]|uniref:zinc finger protein ZAT9-like n=1 Tax=Typha latifolia TaxID=4733 RepID=UPI003C2F6F33
MAMVMDQQQQQQQQQTYKHYCRICKKGFGCGRALGGHMRAHGINDDAVGGHEPDDEPSSCGGWEAGNPSAGSKRMYALRTNPNRLKSCRVCENCGKEFVSWKSFLEHGKCSSEDDDDEADADASEFICLTEGEDDDDDPAIHAAWSKGKRSRRTKATPSSSVPPSSEDEDLANCLVMLSSARVEPMAVVETTEESCASASKEEDRPPPPPRSHPPPQERLKAPVVPPTSSSAAPRGMFECKACKKVFSSHQALGGHRASHKKVKGCFAAKLDDVDDAAVHEDEVLASRDNNKNTNSNNNNNNNSSEISAMALAIVPFDNAPLAVAPLKKKNKVHECSICHRVFTSGQALGGHKRCHWITSNSPDPGPVNKLHPLAPEVIALRPMYENSKPLDLNLPAPVDEHGAVRNADIGSPLRLDVPATVYLQPWNINHSNASKKNKATTSSNNMNNVHNLSSKDNNTEGVNLSVDDEADSKVKLAKLSDLKDINMGGESSPWLQVGIGSSANEGSEP